MDVKPIDFREELLTKGDLIKLLEPLPDDALMRAFCNGCSGFITRLTYHVSLDDKGGKSITLEVNENDHYE